MQFQCTFQVGDSLGSVHLSSSAPPYLGSVPCVLCSHIDPVLLLLAQPCGAFIWTVLNNMKQRSRIALTMRCVRSVFAQAERDFHRSLCAETYRKTMIVDRQTYARTDPAKQLHCVYYVCAQNKKSAATKKPYDTHLS